MPVIKIAGFGGMTPIFDERLIGDEFAAYAENTWLQQGTLQGMPVMTPLYTLKQLGSEYVFRFPIDLSDAIHMPASTWMEFPNADTVVIPGMVTDDEWDRYYWCQPGSPPQYNTKARIDAGDPPYTLGMPYPTVPPTLSSTGGASSTLTTRAYVVLWVSAYGEEGAPSPPAVHTGKIDDVWTLTNIPQPGPADLANRNITKCAIYRTVTAANGFTDYFYVSYVAIGTTSFTDNIPDSSIVGGRNLSSVTFTGPPILDGWIQMPNGIIAGWSGKDILFCEPYLPHAWPVEYQMSSDYDIIGFGVLGQTLMVMTQSRPYAITGVHPSAMTMAALPTIEPCLSRGSIVSTLNGVYYASPNGLILAQPGGAENITLEKVSRREWQSLVPLETIRATRLGDAYYGWGTQIDGSFQISAFATGPTAHAGVEAFATVNYGQARQGILVNLAGTKQAITVLTNPDPLRNLMTDVWTGEVLIIRDNIVYWLDANNPDPAREKYSWKSKKFKTPFMKNLAAARIFFDVPDTVPSVGPYITLRVYADDRQVLVRDINASGELIRLPSGFKATWWQFEVDSIVPIAEIAIANTAKELLGA
jgi:hypothetical protein